MPQCRQIATSENKQLHLFLIKCCIMGKGGVLWGRLVMKNQTLHNVIYRRNRTVYRRKATNLYTKRDAPSFSYGRRIAGCVCISGTKRFDLVMARTQVRSLGEYARAIRTASGCRDGISSRDFFQDKPTRNRQSWSNSPSRETAQICTNRPSSNAAWCPDSFGSRERKQLGIVSRRDNAEATTRSYGSSQEEQSTKTMRFFTHLISTMEHGCSVRKGDCVRDDTTTLHEIYAVPTAFCEPRMAHRRESTCTDVRY